MSAMTCLQLDQHWYCFLGNLREGAEGGGGGGRGLLRKRLRVYKPFRGPECHLEQELETGRCDVYTKELVNPTNRSFLRVSAYVRMSRQFSLQLYKHEAELAD